MTSRPPFRRRLPLSAWLAGLVLSGQAFAQDLQLDLPAGSLEQSLNSLARQSGVEILYASELAAGKRAPALSGSFTAREALDQLLQGSGLSVREQADGSLILVPQPAPGEQARRGGDGGSGQHAGHRRSFAQ